MAEALVVEIYKDYGMKFQEARDEMTKRLYEPEAPQRQKVVVQDEAASMAILQAAMKDSTFKGPRG